MGHAVKLPRRDPAPPRDPATVASMLAPPLQRALQACAKGASAGFSARSSLHFLGCVEWNGDVTPFGRDVLAALGE